jgi:hypothetical protein
VADLTQPDGSGVWLPNFLPSKLIRRESSDSLSAPSADAVGPGQSQFYPPYLDLCSLRVVELRVYESGFGGEHAPPAVAVVLAICTSDRPHDRFVCVHPTALRRFVKEGSYSDIDILTKKVVGRGAYSSIHTPHISHKRF